MDEPLQNDTRASPPRPTSLNHYITVIIKNITVEPTMVLYMMAFMITSVIEQAFFVYKACKVNHGYNETVCRNINEEQYENITKEVQVSKIQIFLNDGLCLIEQSLLNCDLSFNLGRNFGIDN